nr:MAG TPA: hypothetical protein [Caudoviricetes sp.]
MLFYYYFFSYFLGVFKLTNFYVRSFSNKISCIKNITNFIFLFMYSNIATVF